MVSGRMKIVVVHLPMEHRTQEETPATPVIDVPSTQDATPMSVTIQDMTEDVRMVVMQGDGNSSSIQNTDSLDLVSTSIVQERDSNLHSRDRVLITVRHRHSIRAWWEEIRHSKPLRLHNLNRQFQSISRIRRQAKQRLMKGHREKLISLSALDAISLVMGS
jgi:hypothetical protein